MKTHYIHSAKEFIQSVGDDLLADEIRHSLTYGIAERVSQDAQSFGPDEPWFIILETSGRACATAVCTPPHRPILSHLSGDIEPVSSTLAKSVNEIDSAIPGVVGENDFAHSFTNYWCRSYNEKVTDFMSQRIYQLSQLVEPKYSEGNLRKAQLSDEELVVSWATAFQKEAVGEQTPPIRLRQQFRDRIQSSAVYLWESEIPVSMALSTRPTRSGISIGAVYTPPEYRKHGYATSCVASFCRALLRDYQFCVLYTDLSNPTSNSIYKRIGFKHYCDSVQFTYERRAA